MKVYVVAGEPSGDLLASGLMRALRRLVPDVRFRGVGGESMTEADFAGLGRDLTAPGGLADSGDGVTAGRELRTGSGETTAATDEVCSVIGSQSPETKGFKSLFDISEIAVMGIFEVLPRLPLILKRISQTANDIESFQPDVLVTVDSWGFVSALLTRLRKKWRREAHKQIPVVHYVAPQVWAWKKGRARNVARLVDRLMTLLPDEGRWFSPHGLRSDFVGHPVVERMAQATLDPAGFRAAHGIPANATVISVLPGSRHSEVKRLIPILIKSVERLATQSRNLFVVVPTVPGVEKEVREGFSTLQKSVPVCVVTGEEDRYNAFAISKLALAKSGTVSLELVALGVPHLITYTFGRWGDRIARRLVKVRFANIINLLADREIVLEFVLRKCRPDLIFDCAERLLDLPQIAAEQMVEAREVMQRLRLPDILPSDRAAEIVFEMAKRRDTSTNS